MTLGDETTYVRLGFSDIELGMPLQAPLYDGNRRVIFKRGDSIATAHELVNLIKLGLYRVQAPTLDVQYTAATSAVLPARKIRVASALRATLPASANATSSVTGAASSQDSGPAPTPAISRDGLTVLDATKLRTGDLLYMQSSPESPRLQSKLIGYLKGKGLIVTVPESENELVMLRDGQNFIVRFFSGQNAYAFTTAVVKQTSVPYPHVHLSYPKEVRGREIRKGSRVDVDIIASVGTEEDGAHTGSGKIVNLSIGGGALRAKTRLGERDHVINVKFKIQVGEMPTYVAVDCVIRAVTEDDDPLGMPYLHGLQFLKPEPAMALALTAFVYQKIVGEA